MHLWKYSDYPGILTNNDIAYLSSKIMLVDGVCKILAQPLSPLTEITPCNQSAQYVICATCESDTSPTILSVEASHYETNTSFLSPYIKTCNSMCGIYKFQYAAELSSLIIEANVAHLFLMNGTCHIFKNKTKTAENFYRNMVNCDLRYNKPQQVLCNDEHETHIPFSVDDDCRGTRGCIITKYLYNSTSEICMQKLEQICANIHGTLYNYAAGYQSDAYYKLWQEVSSHFSKSKYLDGKHE